MEMRLDLVYRKSDHGVAEVKSRSGGLSARARTLLILVNGFDSVGALLDKAGPDATTILQALLSQGYVEPVERSAVNHSVARPVTAHALKPEHASAPVRSVSTKPSAERTGTTAAAPTAASGVELQALLAPLRREAIARLAPHYGPDVVVVAGPLLQAASLEAYGAALDMLESKLTINLGRKMAARVLAGLRP